MQDGSRFIVGDCMKAFQQIEAGTIDMVFADPPYNIGFKYDNYHDKISDAAYLKWTRGWMQESFRILKPGGAFWFMNADEYIAQTKLIADVVGFEWRNWIPWYYSFGNHCKTKFSRCHAHILYYVKPGGSITFNVESIQIPSDRQIAGDKRANPTGKTPPDVWRDKPEPWEDVWDFNRVAGTHGEREDITPCQLPLTLISRAILTSTNEGQKVLDPFAGSGGTGIAALALKRVPIMFELSPKYAQAAAARMNFPAESVEIL